MALFLTILIAVFISIITVREFWRKDKEYREYHNECRYCRELFWTKHPMKTCHFKCRVNECFKRLFYGARQILRHLIYRWETRKKLPPF